MMLSIIESTIRYRFDIVLSHILTPFCDDSSLIFLHPYIILYTQYTRRISMSFIKLAAMGMSRYENRAAFNDPSMSDRDRISAFNDYIDQTRGLEPASQLTHGIGGALVGGGLGALLSRKKDMGKGVVLGTALGGLAGVMSAGARNQEIHEANLLARASNSEKRTRMLRMSAGQRRSEEDSDRRARHYQAYRSYKY